MVMMRLFICLTCCGVACGHRDADFALEQDSVQLGISFVQTDPDQKAQYDNDEGPDLKLAFFSFVPCLMGCVFLFFWYKTKPKELPETPEPGARQTTHLHTFEDPSLEEAYQSKTGESKLAIGARIIFLVNLLLWLKRLLEAKQEMDCMGHARISGHGTVTRLVFTVLSAICIVKPHEVLFYVILAQTGLFVLWSCLPPYDLSCNELIHHYGSCRANKIWHLRTDRLDCSLQGSTAVQICILFTLLIPWTIPKSKLLYLPWVWLGGLYVGMSIIVRFSISEYEHSPGDVLWCILLIAVAIIVSSHKKISLESSRRKIFLSDRKLHAATKQLYNLLDVMLPPHVIVPMLKNPGAVIAEEVEIASILFIVIVDFDAMASKMPPNDLLVFLNQYFTEFDGICTATRVTKIETVCEEYVACVGVSPEDRNTQKMMGHRHILERLFQAAGQILALQKEDVKFKMGMHSGPIVAGVIGSKLPRYRLFGDTINTAARHMQKGEIGALQFGEETWNNLPKTVSARFRGEVEMKGKGKVKAYLFGEQKNSTPLAQDVTALGHSSSLLETARVGTRRLQSVQMLTTLLSHKQSSDDQTHGESGKGLLAVLWERANQTDEEPATQVSKETKDNFEEVMLHVAPESRRTKLEGNAFNDADLEQKWQIWFYEHVVCGDNVTRRANKMILAFVILTNFDLLYMLWIQSWRRPHEFYDASMRVPVMVLTRSVCFVYLVTWRILCSSEQRLRQLRPKLVQVAILVSTGIICILMYVSYDAIGIMSKKLSRKMVNQIAFLNETYALFYTLLFFLILAQIRCTFLESLWFIPLAMLLMSLRNWTHLYISEQGRAVFITTAVVRVVLAYEAEIMGRRRFQSNSKVEQMQGRLESILDTMMPPLVLQELTKRSLHHDQPLNCHRYLRATVAQSDLAGFTKLASSKKPFEVVEFIGDLFGRFDTLTDKRHVYKVETIGDAYIAGSAEQPLTEIESPTNVVLFGLDMVLATRSWAKERGFDVICRVGVHRGECIGGIVGTDMQRYHLFGQLLVTLDTVEATSAEGRVQITTPVKEAVVAELQKKGDSVERLFGEFEAREDGRLTTSKGEVHEFSEVGGRTYLVKQPEEPLLHAW